MKKQFQLAYLALLFLPLLSSGQILDIGNGSDGPFQATVNTVLASGTYNFTSFTIDPGVTVSITGSSTLWIKCQGAVLIQGTLSVNGGNGVRSFNGQPGGAGGIGVAGGANGGAGGDARHGPNYHGVDGFGPGGGTAGVTWIDNNFTPGVGGAGGGYGTPGMDSRTGNFAPGGGPIAGGLAYGDPALTIFQVGSGGGGGGADDDTNSGGADDGGGGGGAGGGAVRISATTISISGSLLSDGGIGACTDNGGTGGGGSGGAVWLRASGGVTNSGIVSAVGGISLPNCQTNVDGQGGDGGEGRIRIDAGSFIDSGVVIPAPYLGGISNIPTMSQWGLILFGLLLLNLVIVGMRKRKLALN